jgi:hypothetical protein
MTGNTNLHTATLFSARKKFEEPTLDERYVDC